MQIPPVSLDSLLPATNAAAPPATDGGGFARSLQQQQDALAAPAADSAAQSPEHMKAIAARRDGEPRQSGHDNGTEPEGRGAPPAKEAVQPSHRHGDGAGSGDVPLGTVADPFPTPAEITISPDVPVLEGLGPVGAGTPPLESEDPSPALSHASLTDVEVFPEASAQGTPVQPLPAPSLSEVEKPVSRLIFPDDSSAVAGAVPETDASTSPGNPRVSNVPRGEAAASVLGSNPLPTSRLNQTSTVAVEIPEALAPVSDQRVAAELTPVKAGHGAASSLSAAPTQEAVDLAATGGAESFGSREARTNVSTSAAEPLSPEAFGDGPGSGSRPAARTEVAVVAVPRETSFTANPSLDSQPEASAARVEAPTVAPAIGGAPTSLPKGSPERISAAVVRQDVPTSASFRSPVEAAVIDSIRVSPAPSQPVSVSPQAATGIATLAEGLAPPRETVVPPRLREDPRGSRLETSSDRRFAQLLGEPRGAVRVSVAQGESLPVMDTGKGEGAELFFREPGAQVETGIFRAAADNGSNPPVFSAVGQGAATPQAASSGSGTAAATPFTLPVPEEQVYRQVASRLTLVDGERHSRITMRLYPEELGQVKLDLTVEGDRVRVQMHAQNQQVQEVLEKYLPRLRESFEQQGLKLEEAQVTSDSPGQGGRGSFQESRQSFFAARPPGRSAGRMAGEEEPAVTPPSPANSRPGGISLRV